MMQIEETTKKDPMLGSGAEVRVRALLEDAALWRLLAACFRYPDPQTRRDVDDAFGEIERSQERRIDAAPWGAAFRAAAQAWWAADPATLESEHVRLFLGAGPCSLHETAYGDGRRMAGRTVELADIAGFYRAFGFAISEEHPDLPDQLSAELEFVSMLFVKQAYAIAEGQPDAEEVVEKAARDFLDSHLGRWLGAFVEGLQENGADRVRLMIGTLVRDIVKVQCDALGISPKLAEGRLPRDIMQDETFACPRAGEEGGEGGDPTDRDPTLDS